MDSIILISFWGTSTTLSTPPIYMVASLSLRLPSPLAFSPPSDACALSLHTSLPLLFPPSGAGFQYLCLISSPSILKYHLKTYVSPPHTPSNFLFAFIYFILWLPSALKNPSDSLQKTALQRAITAFDMKDCNLSGLKYPMWVVSTCSSILSPWDDGKGEKEYEPGSEGISNVKIPSNAADRFRASRAALPCCTGPQRSQPKVSAESHHPGHLFKHFQAGKKPLHPSLRLPIRELEGKKKKSKSFPPSFLFPFKVLPDNLEERKGGREEDRPPNRKRINLLETPSRSETLIFRLHSHLLLSPLYFL